VWFDLATLAIAADQGVTRRKTLPIFTENSPLTSSAVISRARNL
jgi:hypothetical protein